MVGRVEIVDRDVQRALTRLRRNVADMRPGYQAIGQKLLTRIQFLYRLGIDPYGRPWAPVKDRSGRPLRDKGNLRDAWTYRATGEEVLLSNNRTVSHKGNQYPLAAIHHFGATIRPRSDGPGYLRFRLRTGQWVTTKQVSIPARKQIPDEGLPEPWLNDVLRAIEGHVRD